MNFARDARMSSLIQPIVYSVVAFALGYQARSYFTSLSMSPSTSAASGPGEITGQTRSKSSKSSRSKPSPPPSEVEAPEASETSRPRSNSSSSTDSELDTDSEAEDLALALSSNPQSLKPTQFDEVKLVLVINDSLKMTKGKIAAQAGHATLGCALMMREINPRMYKHWERHGQPKIALRCADTKELEALADHARSLNLCARTIQDAGRTQVAAGSKTILGIGPGPARIINQVTGKLKLL